MSQIYGTSGPFTVREAGSGAATTHSSVSSTGGATQSSGGTSTAPQSTSSSGSSGVSQDNSQGGSAEKSGPPIAVIAGGVAGAVSRTVVSPLERLKIIQYAFIVFGEAAWRPVAPSIESILIFE